jgi:uncharacterized protein
MQDKTVLVTGATGFIGSRFCREALSMGARVIGLSRDAQQAQKKLPGVEFVENLDVLSPEECIDYIVNLAGEPLVAGRWNDRCKQAFIDSRVGTTNRLFEHFQKASAPPSVLVSGSAVGYYGPHQDEPLGEDGAQHDCFASRLCLEWEKSASQFASLGTRICCLRTGIVLGAGGGALSRMLLPFRMGLGGRLGSGKQWMPWIHIADEVAIIFYCLEQSALQGAVNATAPNPVTNRQFTKALGSALHRPTIFPIPEPVAVLLFGEMAKELLLTGQRACPRKLLESGYLFRFAKLDEALGDIV